jgi:hypothetical protein
MYLYIYIYTYVHFEVYEFKIKLFIYSYKGFQGFRAPLTYSDCTTPLGIMRTALMLVEASLPMGCIDEQDDRWGDNFVTPWREAVLSSTDAAGMYIYVYTF